MINTDLVVIKIATRLEQFELKEPFISAQHTIREKTVLIIQITDQNGNIVASECPVFETPGYTEETIEIAKEVIINQISPLICNQKIKLNQLSVLFEPLVHLYPFSCAAIEIGIWQLIAKQENTTLTKLWETQKQCLREGVVIGKQETYEAYKNKINEAVQKKVNRIKLKWDSQMDIILLTKLRKIVPNRVQFAIDLNQSLADEKKGMGLARWVDFIEQPYPKGELKKTAMLQAKLAIPICLDESISSVSMLDKVIGLKAARMINIKPTRVGGASIAIAMMKRCHQYNIKCFIGGMLESPLGRDIVRVLATRNEITEPSDVVDVSWYIKS